MDLEALRRFAADNDFGLTAPLTAEQVRTLAEYWVPNLFFHEDERFHPIALGDMFNMVRTHMDELPPAAREKWRLTVRERSAASPGIPAFVTHDPPILRQPDGSLPVPGPAVHRVLAEGAAARGAMGGADVDDDTAVTIGASFTNAMEHFGATDLLAGGNTAAPGNPWIPRADEEAPGDPASRRPRMTVLAQYLNLLDLLEYELLVERAGDDYPEDGMRREFDIGAWILTHDPDVDPTMPPLTSGDIARMRGDLLRELVDSEKRQTPAPALPLGWTLNAGTWRTVRDHAFLEYSFFYAYNDFERWQTAIFDNEHEGDDEGCCLVFSRRDIDAAATGDIRTVRPIAISTSVHEEWQDADILRRIPAPAAPGPLARDGVTLDAFIAGGSHATYLDPGTHDLVDYGDYWGFVDEHDIWYLAPLVLPISIILAILEHFIDTEDFTSEDGIHGGPDADPAVDPAAVATHVLTLPMSADEHIYDGGHDDLLALRAFPGKWGGHNGLVDKSPPFLPKTKRFLKKLLGGF